MNIVRGLGIIFACLWAGEMISSLVSIPLSGAIIGLLILAGLLKTGIIKTTWIEDVCNCLIKYMAFFFIPPGVAIASYWGLIQHQWCPILVSTIVSTLLVLLATAASYQISLYISNKLKQSKKGDSL